MKKITETEHKEISSMDANAILETYDGLVREVVNHYLWCGESLREGLLQAFEKYEEGHNADFSTYAYPWVKRNVVRAVANSGFVVRITEDEMLLLNRIRLMRDIFKESEHREPAAAEIAARAGLSLKKAWNVLFELNMMGDGVSFDALLSDGDDGSTLLDVFADRKAKGVDAGLLAEDSGNTLRRVLETALTAEEYAVLRLHCGLGTGECMTFAQIGAALGFSVAKAGRLEKAAFLKLRTPVCGRLLRDCLMAA